MSFMGSKPVGNLKSCVRSRPPLVLISMCLASLSIVTTSFAIYFKFDGNVKNPDELSLNDLGRHLNNMAFCRVPNELPVNAHLNSAFLSRSLSYEVSLPAPFLQNTTYWAVLNARDLGLNGSQNVSLRFTLEEASDHHVCATFMYPSAIKFPETNSTRQCSAAPYINTTSTAHLQKTSDVADPTLSSTHCNKTDVVRFELKGKEEWDIMLSEEDKQTISSHLLTTSVFLMVVFLLILCFAVLRGGLPSGNVSTRELDDDLDRVPLTS